MTHLRYLFENCRGVAAMQFAMVLPPLVIVFIGTFGAFDSYRSVQQASFTASTLADLSTRLIEMNDEQSELMFDTGEALLSGWQQDGSYSISISSIVFDPDANTSEGDPPIQVAWSQARPASQIVETGDLANYRVPTLSDGESVILVEIKGTYRPTLNGFGLPAYYTVERTSMRRPRFVNEVPYLVSGG